MLTNKVVIQKINADTGTVRLYQNFDLRSPWSFEFERGIITTDSNPEIFPFSFEAAERFHTANAGGETKVFKSSEGNILFSDDYAIPAGFLVGILFPQNYVPEVFKFKDKPFIPTGVGLAGTSIQPPGHFDVYYNQKERLAAIVFMITSNTYFGFKCIARSHINDFPSQDRFPFYSDLFASLGFTETHPIQISVADLGSYKQYFLPSTDLSQIAELMNRLLAINETRGASITEKESIIKRLKEFLSTGASIVAFTDSAVTIADSYVQGGAVAKIIARLLSYLSL